MQTTQPYVDVNEGMLVQAAELARNCEMDCFPFQGNLYICFYQEYDYS